MNMKLFIFILFFIIFNQVYFGQDKLMSNKIAEINLSDTSILFNNEWLLINRIDKKSNKITLQESKIVGDSLLYSFSQNGISLKGRNKKTEDIIYNLTISDDNNYFQFLEKPKANTHVFESVIYFPIKVTSEYVIFNIHCCKRMRNKKCKFHFCESLVLQKI